MSLDKKQVFKAVTALFAFIQSEKKNSKSSLFEEDEDDISLQISLKQVPSQLRLKPFRIPIPHTIYGRENKQICLFTKDPQDQYEELLERNPVDNLVQVISITKLRKEYKQYKDRRDLLATYDLFLADDRIIPTLPALLGKKFFEKKKQPTAVALKRANFVREMEKARDSAYFFCSNGPCCAIRIATSGMSRQEVCQNIMASIDKIANSIPKGKWKNIQAIHLKSHNSVALPIYTSLPLERLTLTEETTSNDTDEKTVKGPAPAGKKRGKQESDDNNNDNHDTAGHKSAEKKKDTKKKMKTPKEKKKTRRRAAAVEDGDKTAPAPTPSRKKKRTRASASTTSSKKRRSGTRKK